MRIRARYFSLTARTRSGANRNAMSKDKLDGSTVAASLASCCPGAVPACNPDFQPSILNLLHGQELHLEFDVVPRQAVVEVEGGAHVSPCNHSTVKRFWEFVAVIDGGVHGVHFPRLDFLPLVQLLASTWSVSIPCKQVGSEVEGRLQDQSVLRVKWR